MLNLYLENLQNEIDYYKSMGVSNKNIIKKIRSKYRGRYSYRQTKTCYKFLDFIFSNSEIDIKNKVIRFCKIN